MNKQFVVEVKRDDQWVITTYHARPLEDAIALREAMKRDFPGMKYRVTSILPEEYFATVA